MEGMHNIKIYEHNYLSFTYVNIHLISFCDMNEMGGACNAIGIEERHIHGFVGKSEEKRQLGIPWRR